MTDIQEQRISFKSQGYGLIHYDDGPIHSYPYDAPWLTDQRFRAIYEAVRANTLVDRIRCYSLYLLVEQFRQIPGDILEVGTWRGGTAGILAKLAPEKTIFVADTFEGVVKSSEWEHYEDRTHSDTSEELVVEFFRNTLKVSNFKILKGIFPEETGNQVVSDKLSLVYLDLDVYLSTKDAFQFIWDRVSLHGIVVLDDYGFTSACPGIKKFIDEIKDDDDKILISNTNGQAYIIKK